MIFDGNDAFLDDRGGRLQIPRVRVVDGFNLTEDVMEERRVEGMC